MENIKQKKEVIYGLAIGTIILLISILYYADFSNKKLEKTKEDYTYVSKLFDEGVRTVVSTEEVVIRPYNNADVKVLKGFYDYKGEEKSQEKSIINHDTTYMQNSGVVYGGVDENFDVVSILDGKVTSIKEDKLLGKIVTIDNGNNIITTYQSLSEVTVKENDEISKGTVIGKAGESNLETDLGKHILFEINIDGKNINPEECYDKQISALKTN